MTILNPDKLTKEIVTQSRYVGTIFLLSLCGTRCASGAANPDIAKHCHRLGAGGPGWLYSPALISNHITEMDHIQQ